MLSRIRIDISIIIFTSDHGDCLTDHGHSQKWTMYDVITRIPLAVWAPGRFPARRVDSLCQQMDLGPTILELAGVEVPPTLEAVSDSQRYPYRKLVAGVEVSNRLHER
ncbi:MAG TPA: sulfatase-like hydrolase/transferase [Pirellulaceae bacterium]|nr:sulfatase-like hydrolase/transferase [Pirellulaceae bacterium]